jgi:hypothetical protein
MILRNVESTLSLLIRLSPIRELISQRGQWDYIPRGKGAISDLFIDRASKQDTFLRRSSILKLYWPIRPRLHPSHLEANITLR